MKTNTLCFLLLTACAFNMLLPAAQITAEDTHFLKQEGFWNDLKLIRKCYFQRLSVCSKIEQQEARKAIGRVVGMGIGITLLVTGSYYYRRWVKAAEKEWIQSYFDNPIDINLETVIKGIIPNVTYVKYDKDVNAIIVGFDRHFLEILDVSLTNRQKRAIREAIRKFDTTITYFGVEYYNKWTQEYTQKIGPLYEDK